MINDSLHDIITLYWGIPCQRTLWMPEVYVGAGDWTTWEKSNIFLDTKKPSLCQWVLDPHVAGGWQSIQYHCILVTLFFSSLDICFWPFSKLHTELDGLLWWPSVNVLMLPRTKIKTYDVRFCWKAHKLIRFH